MTEDEAKTKWCPFAKTYSQAENGASGGWNRQWDGVQSSDPAGLLCIASACMAWRLGKSGTRTESRGPEGGYLKVEIANGYCGLAGAPQ